MSKYIKYLFYPIALLLLVLTCVEFFPLFIYACTHLSIYQWMLCGMAIYFIIRKFNFVSRNESLMMTASHELSHMIVGMMFLHKIHSIQANEDEGVVYHSGNNFGGIFISLAPYCLPIFTFAFLLLRIMGDAKMLYIFDLFIGFTLAFHLVCFCNQTRLYQPDIKKQGYFKAFLFLLVAWFFNASIILLSIRKGIVGAVTYIFPQYWDDITNWWNIIF